MIAPLLLKLSFLYCLIKQPPAAGGKGGDKRIGEEGKRGGGEERRRGREEEGRMLMDSISPLISHLSFVILYLNLCFRYRQFPIFPQAFDEFINRIQLNAPSLGRLNNTFPPTPAQ